MPALPIQPYVSEGEDVEPAQLPQSLRIRNRRKRYLDLHPEYFESSALELVGMIGLSERVLSRD